MTTTTKTRRSTRKTKAPTTRARWTPGELNTLKRGYKNRSNAELGEQLGRKPAAIMAMATRLGLAKSKKHLSRTGAENISSRWDL